MIVFLLKFESNKKYSFILLVIFIFSISFSVLKPTYERMYKHTLSQLNIFSNDYKKDHQLLFETGIQIFNDNKIIGSGVKGFRNQCKNKKYFIEGEGAQHILIIFIFFFIRTRFNRFLFLLTSFIILNLIIFLD